MARITQARREEMAEAMKSLREVLADIDVIYTDVVHVSASGMFRCIRPFIITEERRPWDLTYLVARAGIGKASERHGGIEMGGTGMDMGFALVYEIGRAVHADGAPWRCRGARCGSNEHVNSPRTEPGPDVWHTADSGYRFRKETL